MFLHMDVKITMNMSLCSPILFYIVALFMLWRSLAVIFGGE